MPTHPQLSLPRVTTPCELRHFRTYLQFSVRPSPARARASRSLGFSCPEESTPQTLTAAQCLECPAAFLKLAANWHPRWDPRDEIRSRVGTYATQVGHNRKEMIWTRRGSAKTQFEREKTFSSLDSTLMKRDAAANGWLRASHRELDLARWGLWKAMFGRLKCAYRYTNSPEPDQGEAAMAHLTESPPRTFQTLPCYERQD